MTRLVSLTIAALFALSVSACAKTAPADGATAKAPPPAAGEAATPMGGAGADPAADHAADPGTEAVGDATPVDTGKLTMAEVTSDKVVSVHNSMGDRINIESVKPWPPVLGNNEWKVSFKASPDAPMDLVDHLAIEVTMEGAGPDAPAQNASYSGGQSGGTLMWNPAVAGTYLITTRVMRKNQETGLVQFKVEVPAGAADVAPAPETGDAPVDPAPATPPDAPAE